MGKANPATQIVQRAQRNYPKALASVKSYFGEVPYGQEVIDRRTADKRLTQMTPESMMQLAQTNPIAAEQAAARLQQLDAKAAALPPLPTDEYQGGDS